MLRVGRGPDRENKQWADIISLRGCHTGIGYLCFTNVQHGKLYIHNNTFYSVIYKIKMNFLFIKFKGKIIIQGIAENFIDTFIQKQVMTIFKLYIVHFKMFITYSKIIISIKSYVVPQIIYVAFKLYNWSIHRKLHTVEAGGWKFATSYVCKTETHVRVRPVPSVVV